MINIITGNYAYWFILLLVAIGFYGMIFKRHFVKKVIGMNILQVAIIMFYLASAARWNATVPVKTEQVAVQNYFQYINPLPHILMLTAIVVGVATNGVAYALLITIYKRYGTLDENELLKKMQAEEEDE